MVQGLESLLELTQIISCIKNLGEKDNYMLGKLMNQNFFYRLISNQKNEVNFSI